MFAIALCLPACGGEVELGGYDELNCDLAEPPADKTGITLYLSTFWDDPREQAALDKLLTHNPFYPNVTRTSKQTRVSAQKELVTIFKDGKQPDAFQANGGSDVLRWLFQAKRNDMCSLNPLADVHGWRERYFPEALAPVSCTGTLYALPVGIHRLNLLFYNRRLFETLRMLPQAPGEELLEPSALTSVDQLIQELERVERLRQQSKLSFVPLALGAKRGWPLTVLAFENVLLSLDKKSYLTLWKGGLSTGDATLRRRLVGTLDQMVTDLQSLVQFSTLDGEVDWQDTVQQVASGEALFTINGDWAWAQVDAGEVEDVAVVPFPGTASTFVYTPDSFGVPRSTTATTGRSRAFLEEVVADAEALADFSELKHSIPAQVDFDVEKLRTPDLKATYQQFTNCSAGVGGCELLLATSGLAPPPGYDPCFDDVEVLLFKAVTDVVPSELEERENPCNLTWPPISKASAKARLLETLLNVARESFAPNCPR